MKSVKSKQEGKRRPKSQENRNKVSNRDQKEKQQRKFTTSFKRREKK